MKFFKVSSKSMLQRCYRIIKKSSYERYLHVRNDIFFLLID